MKLIKHLKKIKITRWSTLIPFFIYLIFILLILNITFPMRSKSTSASSSLQSILNNNNNVILNDSKEKNNDIILVTSISRSDSDRIKSDNYNNNNNNNKKDRSKIINHQQQQLLKSTFQKTDLDGDKLLTIQEIARYINKRIKQHIELAIKVNPIIFAEIDGSPRDGLISWDEYHKYFLLSRGYDEEYIKNHNEKRHIKLDRKTKEMIMKDKAHWNEAARTDSFSLTLDEFLAFRHPESSAVNLLNRVDDMLLQFDDDGNDLLSINEFTDVIVDNLDENWRLYMQSKTIEERRQEFKRLIDKNNDDTADRSELLSYVDPRHPRHSLLEAVELIELADKNDDKQLSLEEVLTNSNIIISSKMIESLDSLHEEY